MAHRVDDLREHGVDEDCPGARVAEDECQLGATEPEVQRVDDAGTEEARVVQLEVLVAVPGDDGVPVAAADAELGPQRGGQPEHPLEVPAERSVVLPVVEANPTGGAVRRGE